MELTSKSQETIIAVIKGKPIEADRIITNRHGKKFEFDRVAVNTRGGFCLDQMRDDEVILAPGLIYREVKGV